jgi:AraC-like DNA-binding protein
VRLANADDMAERMKARHATTRTVLARVVGRMVDQAVAEGMDRSALIEASGLAGVDLSDGDARVPVSAQVALWQLFAKGISDPGFGVRMGASLEVRQAGLLGYLMLYSAPLGEALDRLVRYGHVLNDAVQVALDRSTPGQVAIVAQHPELGIGLPFAVDYRSSALLSVCRQITGVEIVPVEACFEYPQRTSTIEHARFFRCPLRFGQPDSRIVLAERDLCLGVRHGDEALVEYLSTNADLTLHHLLRDASRGSSSVTERVRSAVWNTLSDGRPTLQRIASVLDMPSRTLQRRLAGEGTSLAQEIEDIRRAMATATLRDRSVSIEEVAFLLGYPEPSTLFRSFRRWTGMTPQQYRAAMAG